MLGKLRVENSRPTLLQFVYFLGHNLMIWDLQIKCRGRRGDLNQIFKANVGAVNIGCRSKIHGQRWCRSYWYNPSTCFFPQCFIIRWLDVTLVTAASLPNIECERAS